MPLHELFKVSRLINQKPLAGGVPPEGSTLSLYIGVEASAGLFQATIAIRSSTDVPPEGSNVKSRPRIREQIDLEGESKGEG
jgi:hypothetical protein